MYLIDITRTNDEIDSDTLLSKDSMDAKRKIMKYISDFTLANYNIIIDKDVLDQNLDIKMFSLKQFIGSNFNLNIDKDLIIQAMPTDKEHCLVVKFFNENVDDYPILYLLNKDKQKEAKVILAYMVNDELIREYQDDLSIYEKNKIDFNKLKNSYQFAGVKCNIISLYRNGIFMEELLDKNITYNELNKGTLGISI